MDPQTKLRGIFAPVVTPFRSDLSADHALFVKHCGMLSSQGVGLVLFGTTSEATSLSLEERSALLESVVASGINVSTLMAGTGACALPETVRLTKHAIATGCIRALVAPPFYYKDVSEDGVFRYFSEVIERVGDERLQIYLYNIPRLTYVPITANLVERLLDAYPNQVAGLKDSSGEWVTTSAFIEAFSSNSFSVFVGSEKFLLKSLRLGGAGCISAAANLFAAPMIQLFRTWRDSAADALQLELEKLRSILEAHPLIPAIKSCVARHTGVASWALVRPPLVPLETPVIDLLHAKLASTRFRSSVSASL